MGRNFWQQERRRLFKSLLKEYIAEGYNKEDFINNIWDESYEEE